MSFVLSPSKNILKNSGINNSSRLVIINDGSKDSTYDIMLKLKGTYPLFIPITKPNGGHGSSVLFGYRYAIENKADYIFQTDSDGQTNPDEFEAFCEGRKFVENVVCFLLRLVFGIKVKDANAPFRLMKTDVIAKYINKLPEHFNLPNIMFTTYFVYFKENVKFIDITFKPRQGGKNSINFLLLQHFKVFKCCIHMYSLDNRCCFCVHNQ